MLATIYSSSFKPLLELYNNEGIIDYEESLYTEFEKIYKSQLQERLISKDTFKNVGLRIINEDYITESYIWKVYHDEKIIINSFTLLFD